MKKAKKQEISALIIGDSVRYTVKIKDHWWSRWRYIMDGMAPRLFTFEELRKFGFFIKTSKETSLFLD